MPPKKKPRIQGQQTLGAFLRLESQPEPDDGEIISATAAITAGSTAESSSSVHRGGVASWRDFRAEKYLKKHEWLVIKPEGIYCKFCIKMKPSIQSGSSVFISKPYTLNRPDKLVQHERSQAHQSSAISYRESLVRDATKTSVDEMVRDSATITADGEALCDALRCIYFLMKKEIAHTTNFADLEDLCILLGNDKLPRLQKGKNLNNRSEQRMAEMVAAIGKSLEVQILEEIHQSKYFSIIINEATDISVTKTLGICIQYLDINATVCVRNITMLEVADGRAETITDTLLHYLTDAAPVKLEIAQLAGGASDGASVMAGPHSGVMARLKAQVPLFVSTHCAAHRLSLAAVDAVDGCTLVSRFHLCINQIYTFFSRSTTRTSMLKEMQALLNETQLKLQHGTETRWLSNQAAVDALRRSLKPVKLVLEQVAAEGDAIALGLSIHVKKPTFVATLLILSDVLEVLGKMSRCFQANSLNLLSVEGLVQHYIAALETLKENPLSDGYTSKLHATLSSLEISETLNEAEYLPSIQQYIEKLIVNVKNRFPQSRVLTLLGYLDPRNVEKATPTTVMELAECFDLDQSKLWSEYLVYRSLAGSLEKPEKQHWMEKVIEVVLGPDNQEAMQQSFPLLSDILYRLAVLPATSAQAERLFSAMKRIKTAQRNRLKTETLSSLIRVSTEGPPLQDWDPIPAMKMWESSGPSTRRIETSKH